MDNFIAAGAGWGGLSIGGLINLDVILYFGNTQGN